MSVASVDRYGMNILPRNEQQNNIQRCKELGLKWARIDIGWHDVEPKKGQYHWSLLDTFFSEARKQGMQTLASISYTPSWANGGGDRTRPPVDAGSWQHFIRQTVSRYGASVGHWSIWNEPNLKRFYSGSEKEYIDRILLPGIDAVKAVNKNYAVLAPDLAHTEAWDKWLSNVLKCAGNKIDIISHHIYKDNIEGMFNSLSASLDGPFYLSWIKPSLRSVIKSSGFSNKPVWIAETGWQSDKLGNDGQAGNYKKAVKLFEQMKWINKVFFYELTEDPEWECKFGILNNSTPKPAFIGLKESLRG